MGSEMCIRDSIGSDNAFFGSSAGSNNLASQNSFFGALSGLANTTGLQNSFFGYRSGSANTTGVANSAFGFWAGNTSTTGSNNAFFGSLVNNSRLVMNFTRHQRQCYPQHIYYGFAVGSWRPNLRPGNPLSGHVAREFGVVGYNFSGWLAGITDFAKYPCNC